MDSLEKLNQLVHDAQHTEPESEEAARAAQLMTIALPIIGPMVPEDPGELDDMILKLTGWLLSIRSDDAVPAAELHVEAPAPAGGDA